MEATKTKSSKTVKKTKATTVKVTSTKKTTKNFSTDNIFYLNNGQTIDNLKDLPKVLKELDDATYYYHVTDSKNDFSAWISDVFGNTELAMAIGEIKDKNEMIKAIKKGI